MALDYIEGTSRSAVEVDTLYQRLVRYAQFHVSDHCAAGALDAARWCLALTDRHPITGATGPATRPATRDEAYAAATVRRGLAHGDPTFAAGAEAWLDWWTCQAPAPEWLSHRR